MILVNLSSFNQDMANEKMLNAYYLKRALKGTGPVTLLPMINSETHQHTYYPFHQKLLVLPPDEYQNQGIILSKTALSF